MGLSKFLRSIDGDVNGRSEELQVDAVICLLCCRSFGSSYYALDRISKLYNGCSES